MRGVTAIVFTVVYIYTELYSVAKWQYSDGFKSGHCILFSFCNLADYRFSQRNLIFFEVSVVLLYRFISIDFVVGIVLYWM